MHVYYCTNQNCHDELRTITGDRSEQRLCRVVETGPHEAETNSNDSWKIGNWCTKPSGKVSGNNTEVVFVGTRTKRVSAALCFTTSMLLIPFNLSRRAFALYFRKVGEIVQAHVKRPPSYAYDTSVGNLRVDMRVR